MARTRMHIKVIGLLFVLVAVAAAALVWAAHRLPGWNLPLPGRVRRFYTPEELARIIQDVALIMSVVGWVVGVPSLLAGLGLWARVRAARVLAVSVAFFYLLLFPVGTALGLYIIWILTRAEAFACFGRRAVP